VISSDPLCNSFTIPNLCVSHHDQAVLVAGKGSAAQPSGQRHAISYWSLYDNKIMRKFRGHTDKVVAISMSPADDTFLSSSNDGSVRLWNIQQAGCLAELKLPPEATGTPVAVFDSTGLVFSVVAAMSGGTGDGGHYVHLYDARNYSGGAFAEFKVQRGDLEKAILSHVSMDVNRASFLSRSAVRSVQFNVSGSSIMIGTDNGMNVLLDGFEGNIQRVIYDVNNTSSRPAVACFSSDDKTVLCGNDNGSISCWDLASGMVVKQLEGHIGAVNCIAANPKYAQLASACTQTALWLW
jgi:COMPASS component SWD2